jgi:hypothetical protein
MDYDDFDSNESAYREASKHFLGIIIPAISHVASARSIEVGLAQVKAALGITDESMSDAAARLGVSKQCISKGAKEFVRENNLPMPAGMKSEESSTSYRNARIAKLSA